MQRQTYLIVWWHHLENLNPNNKVKANVHFSRQMAPLCEYWREYLWQTLLQWCICVHSKLCRVIAGCETVDLDNDTHGETQWKARVKSNSIDLYAYTQYTTQMQNLMAFSDCSKTKSRTQHRVAYLTRWRSMWGNQRRVLPCPRVPPRCSRQGNNRSSPSCSSGLRVL